MLLDRRSKLARTAGVLDNLHIFEVEIKLLGRLFLLLTNNQVTRSTAGEFLLNLEDPHGKCPTSPFPSTLSSPAKSRVHIPAWD